MFRHFLPSWTKTPLDPIELSREKVSARRRLPFFARERRRRARWEAASVEHALGAREEEASVAVEHAARGGSRRGAHVREEEAFWSDNAGGRRRACREESSARAGSEEASSDKLEKEVAVGKARRPPKTSRWRFARDGESRPYSETPRVTPAQGAARGRCSTPRHVVLHATRDDD